MVEEVAQGSFGALPPDLWAKVANRFSPEALSLTPQACSSWAKAMDSDELWSSLCESHFPGTQDPDPCAPSPSPPKVKYAFQHQLRCNWRAGTARVHRFIEPRSVLCSDLKNNMLICGSFDGELRQYPLNSSGLYRGSIEELGFIDEAEWWQGTNTTLGVCGKANSNTHSPLPATNSRFLQGEGSVPPVNCVAVMDCGLVGAGLRNNKVSIWDLSTPEPVRVAELQGHDKQVLSLCSVENGTGGGMVASGGADRSVCVFDLNRSTERAVMRISAAHRGVVNAISSAQNSLATAAGDGNIRIFDLRITGTDASPETASAMIRAGSGLWPATCVQFGDERKHLVYCGAGDGGIRVLDLRMPESWVLQNTTCERAVTTLSTRGDRYACGTVEGGVLVFGLHDSTSEDVSLEVKVHADRVSQVHLTERSLISCSQDHSVVIHDFSPCLV